MNVLYLCKISESQARGNQIDIPKKIATGFFNIPEAKLVLSENAAITVCHARNTKKFETIEIQLATNPRFSTKLNKFLEANGDDLSGDDLIMFEKIGRSYCVSCIKNGNEKYGPLVSLFEENEKHMLLSADLFTNISMKSKIQDQYGQFIAAIRTKPFLLLAGISGTGKSRIVRDLARACDMIDSDPKNTPKPSNFQMIQVKPNWHDSSELFGYVSRIDGEKFITGEFLRFVAKAWEYNEAISDKESVPFFLCLDEMNLAPVEQYFAEYLSILETRTLNESEIITDPILEKNRSDWYRLLTDELTSNDKLRAKFLKEGIAIPDNLIVVGTVNMDETTYSFSRKVLDRAMTIEMNEVDLMGGLTDKSNSKLGTLTAKQVLADAVEGKDVYTSYKDICDKVITNYLQPVNEVLDGTPFKIAYRTRNDFLIYVVNSIRLHEEEEQNEIIFKALDEVTNMKILSRIEGDESKVSKTFLGNLKYVIQSGLGAYLNQDGSNKNDLSSISLSKLDTMTKKLDSGYTSFWD